jgi:hypothetical protein
LLTECGNGSGTRLEQRRCLHLDVVRHSIDVRQGDAAFSERSRG